MFKKSNALTVLSAATMALALVACGGTPSTSESASNSTSVSVEKTPIELKVWCPSEDNTVMDTIITNFKAAEATAHSTLDYTITVENVPEGDVRTELLKDPDAGADVMAMVDDGTQTLGGEAGYLYEIPTNSTYYTEATTLNSAGAVSGAKVGGKLYGFPETADNGYFLYYNSNYITAQEAGSLNAMVAKAAELSKKVYYDYNNGWYGLSYLNSNGGIIGVDAEGKQICNWNTAAGGGVAALEAMYALGANTALVANSSNGDLKTGFESGLVIATFSGTWMSADLLAVDGVKCAKLPTLTVGTKECQLSSFSGGKNVGVNKVTAHPTEAMRFAAFMTNEASQTIRFNARGIGPSNLAAAASEAVAANPALAALAAQSKFSVSQSAVLSKDANSTYWDAVGGLGTYIKGQDWGTATNAQTALDLCVAAFASQA